MPLILRPSGKHFKFVDSAYVHGIMDGQVLVAAEQNMILGVTAMTLRGCMTSQKKIFLFQRWR